MYKTPTRYSAWCQDCLWTYWTNKGIKAKEHFEDRCRNHEEALNHIVDRYTCAKWRI